MLVARSTNHVTAQRKISVGVAQRGVPQPEEPQTSNGAAEAAPFNERRKRRRKSHRSLDRGAATLARSLRLHGTWGIVSEEDETDMSPT